MLTNTVEAEPGKPDMERHKPGDLFISLHIMT